MTTLIYTWAVILLNLVRIRGLEPPRLATLIPETSASTNSAISAVLWGAMIKTKSSGVKYFFKFSKQIHHTALWQTDPMPTQHCAKLIAIEF